MKLLTDREIAAVLLQIARLEGFQSAYATEMLGYYRKLLELYAQ